VFLLFLLFAFIIGLNIRYGWVIGLLLAFVFVVISFKRKFSKKRKLILFSFLLIGFGISFINPSFNKSTYKGFVIDSKENYFIFSSDYERLYVYRKNNTYEIGDFLSISGSKEKLSFVRLESQFDYKGYLNRKGVNSELKIKEVKTLFKNPVRIKQVRENFLSNFNEDTRNTLNFFLFSSSGENELTSSLKTLHLTRLISISGLYFDIFISLVSKLLAIKMKKKYASLVSFIVIFPLLILSFPKFSSIRFIFMFSFKWINNYILKRKITYLNMLSISSFCFLGFDYHLVYQDSFLLSLFIPMILYLIKDITYQKKKFQKYIITQLIIYFFFLPFEIKYYYEVSFFMKPLEALLTPLFVPFFLLSVLGLFKIPIYSLANGYNSFLSSLMGTIKPFFWGIHVPNFSPILVFIYYSIFVLYLYYRSIRFIPIYRMIQWVSLVLLTIYMLPIKNTFSSEVTFINVGQGDACLIRNQNQTVLVDTGGNIYQDIAKTSLINFFKKKRIYKIDYVFITHNDFDHSGALTSLIKNFRVKKVINSIEMFPNNYIGIKFTNYNKYFNSGSEENDKSLVLGFTLAKKNYLLMGDAPKSIEQQIMKDNAYIPCDILKIGHHGSITSTSEEFLDYLKPKEAVISVGKNQYGHPDKRILSLLNKKKIKIRRTDLEGSVHYYRFI